MRGLIAAVTAVAACLMATSSAFAVGHVVYSFESPDIGSGSTAYFDSIFVSGTTHPFNAINDCGIEVHDNYFGTAWFGNQYLELNARCPGGITSSESTGKGGFVLSYSFSPRPHTDAQDNVMDVAYDGKVIDRVGPIAGGETTNWIRRRVAWTSPYGATTVRLRPLTFRSVGSNPSGGTVGVYLDHVMLEYPDVGRVGYDTP